MRDFRGSFYDDRGPKIFQLLIQNWTIEGLNGKRAQLLILKKKSAKFSCMGSFLLINLTGFYFLAGVRDIKL